MVRSWLGGIGLDFKRVFKEYLIGRRGKFLEWKVDGEGEEKGRGGGGGLTEVTSF